MESISKPKRSYKGTCLSEIILQTGEAKDYPFYFPDCILWRESGRVHDPNIVMKDSLDDFSFPILCNKMST